MFGANRGGLPTVASIALAGLAALTSLPRAGAEATPHEYVHREPVHEVLRHEARTYPPRSPYLSRTEMTHVASGHAASVDKTAAVGRSAHTPPPALVNHEYVGGAVPAQRLFQAHLCRDPDTRTRTGVLRRWCNIRPSTTAGR